MKRTLIGGVGYRNLTDMSLGPLVMEELRGERWPEQVVVEDLSVGPIAVVHWLSSREPPFERVVVFAAASRGRRPGALFRYRWNRELPDAVEVQERVAEAVTGVIDLDNFLVVTRQFEALPAEVYVIEVEPEVEAFGLELSPGIRALVPEVKALTRQLAEREDAGHDWEVSGLGGSTSPALDSIGYGGRRRCPS